MSKAWLATVTELEASSPQHAQPTSDASLTNVLRVIGSFDGLSAETPAAPRSAPKDWSTLIGRVQDAAIRMRSVETEAQAQDLRVQQILDKVRADVAEAEAHVHAADARLLEANHRAATLQKAAEERVHEAEERARLAEEWLLRVHETITDEFFGTATSDQAMQAVA